MYRIIFPFSCDKSLILFRIMGKAFGFLQYHVIMIIVNSRTVRTKSYNTSFIAIRNSFDAFINI